MCSVSNWELKFSSLVAAFRRMLTLYSHSDRVLVTIHRFRMQETPFTWKVPVNISEKQSWTGDKGRYYRSAAGHRADYITKGYRGLGLDERVRPRKGNFGFHKRRISWLLKSLLLSQD
jgi:hypothetical protein